MLNNVGVDNQKYRFGATTCVGIPKYDQDTVPRYSDELFK
jgi:hypothetical protein